MPKTTQYLPNPILPRILIIGVGNLGKRNLEGLVSLDCECEILVLDTDPVSIENAAKAIDIDESESGIKVVYFSEIQQLYKIDIDVCIVSTNARERRLVISTLTKYTAVKYWILEKILATSIRDLDEIESIVSHSLGAWVNTPRRCWPIYRTLKERFSETKPINGTISNYSGFLSNSIHMIDVFCYLNDCQVDSISTNYLNSNWQKTKRKGYYDLLGSLEISYENGATLRLVSLTSTISSGNINVKLWNSSEVWLVSEQRSAAISTLGRCVYCCPSPLQSENIRSIVKSILNYGTCELPFISHSSEQHRVYLASLNEHLARIEGGYGAEIPIT